MTADELVGLIGTYSTTITSAPEQREAELDRARGVAAGVVVDGVVTMPMQCRCWRAVRRWPAPRGGDQRWGPSPVWYGRSDPLPDREVLTMLSRSERRLASWSDKIQKWADKRIEEFGSNSKEGQYAFGVSLGVSVAKGKTTAPKNMKKRYKPQAIKGYEDVKWLLSKAVRYGDAPEGQFLPLLQAPRTEPVTGSWSRRDSPD